ncbi:Calcium-dependent protein kinase 4, partial [Rhizophlyctis rosea]
MALYGNKRKISDDDHYEPAPSKRFRNEPIPLSSFFSASYTNGDAVAATNRIPNSPIRISSSPLTPYPSPPRSTIWDRDSGNGTDVDMGCSCGDEEDDEEVICTGVVHRDAEEDEEEGCEDDETDEYEDRYCGLTERRAREAVRQAIYTNEYLTRNYTITELLGWGGNGVVMGAIRQKDKHSVAIKLVYKKNDSQTLPHEIALLLSPTFPTHPNILKAHSHFEDSQAHYLVTERFGSDFSTSRKFTPTSTSSSCPHQPQSTSKSDPDTITVRLPPT